MLKMVPNVVIKNNANLKKIVLSNDIYIAVKWVQFFKCIITIVLFIFVNFFLTFFTLNQNIKFSFD